LLQHPLRSTGTEEVPVVQSGATVQKTTAQAIADLASGGGTVTQSITSGAGPVDVTFPAGDWARLIVNVTSGGTAGNETINIPNPTVDANGYNTDYQGRRVIVYVETLTDPADVLNVTYDGSSVNPINDIDGTLRGRLNPSVLDYAGASLVSVWQGYNWACDYTSGNTDSEIERRNALGVNAPTWDPTLYVGGVAVDPSHYTARGGRYYESGKLVTAAFQLAVDDLGGLTGDITIGTPMGSASNDIVYTLDRVVTIGASAGPTQLFIVNNSPDLTRMPLMNYDAGGLLAIDDTTFEIGTTYAGSMRFIKA
jgi:hypothetical protein